MNVTPPPFLHGVNRGAVLLVASLLAIFITTPSAAFAQCSKSSPANCAYVTDGSGGDIFAVDRTTLASSKLQSIKNATLNDIRVASDNMIYVTTQNSVLRVSESGLGKAVHVFDATTPIPGPFDGIRFSPTGDAYVNSPQGVYRLQINGANSFPVSAVQVTDSVCGKSAGLAVWPTGDLLIACDSQVLKCPAGLDGVAAGCTGANTPQPLITAGGTITGLAVDAAADVLVASGSSITRYCTPPICPVVTSTTLATFASDFPAYIDTAPFPQGFPPSQAGGTPPCNSGEVTVFVSTADASSQNGKVWAINTASTSSTVKPPQCDLLPAPVVSGPSAISSTRPSVGLGVSQTARTLAKTLNSANGFSDLYVQGPYSIQITNTGLAGPCTLDLTAQREPAAALDAILATATDSVTHQKVPARAIPFNGEESWRTSFHGGLPASGCSATGSTHIGITASVHSINPWIALIDDSTNKATLDPIPNVYGQFPLVGVPGDPIKIQNGTLFTSNARIVLVDRQFIVNSGSGYLFSGFLPPLANTTDLSQAGMNQINAGKSFVLKFTLSTSSGPISNSQGAAVVTGISIARLSCDGSAGAGCQGFVQMLVDPTGQSATPPSFNFSSGQFHFNVDTNQPDGTKWCNGIYEATANSDSFSPQAIYFTVVGAPALPSCF